MSTSEDSTQTQQQGASIRPPKPLVINSDVATNWKRWKQQWKFYVTATMLDKKSPEVQAATLMATIGEDAFTVFESFAFADDEQKNISRIVEKFDDSFTPKANGTYER